MMITRRYFLTWAPWLPVIGKAALLAGAEWRWFVGELAHVLDLLKEGEFLILDARRGPYYVQFHRCGPRYAGAASSFLRAEAVSNTYLSGGNRLSQTAQSKLLDLGWNAPTAPDSPNYFLHLALPAPTPRVAHLAVDTLRHVYAVAHPCDLCCKAFHKQGGAVDFAQLRLPTRQQADEADDLDRQFRALGFEPMPKDVKLIAIADGGEPEKSAQRKRAA